MKRLAIFFLSSVLSFGLSMTSAVAADGKIAVKTVSNGTIVSSSRDHSEELLIGVLLQMAWQHTYQEKFEDFTKTITEEMSKKGAPTVALPFDVEIESSLKRTKLNFVYRF